MPFSAYILYNIIGDNMKKNKEKIEKEEIIKDIVKDKEDIDIKNMPKKEKIKEKKKESLFIRFVKQFNDFMIITLIIAAIISAAIAKITGNGDYIDSIIIIVIVIFNALMGLIQEAKAEKSLEALKKMSEKKIDLLKTELKNRDEKY